MYKIKLSLRKDADVYIINESNSDVKQQFNEKAIKDLLKNYSNNNGFRSNIFNLFVENNYLIDLIDSSGYMVKNEKGEVSEFNKLANQLDLSLTIKHTAPTGDAYGKDYSKNYDENMVYDFFYKLMV